MRRGPTLLSGRRFVGPDDSPRNVRRTARRRVLVTLVLGSLLAATGCSTNIEDYPSMMEMPRPVTEQGNLIYSLWQGSWLAALAVGATVWGLIIWACIFFRRRKGETGLPPQVRYNLPIEILYTIVPFLMVLVLFYFTARDQAELYELTDEPEHTINVIGFRWSWTFNYTDEDVYDTGSPAEPPTLVLPEGERIRFDLESADVIHSFWIPAFLFKMDVIPGRLNQFEVTPDEQGSFVGKCAELCGADHARMLFNVRVVSQEEYDNHVEELRDAGQTGQLTTETVNNDAGTSQNTGDQSTRGEDTS
jgi:cytochrome c oxidase subunit II